MSQSNNPLYANNKVDKPIQKSKHLRVNKKSIVMSFDFTQNFEGTWKLTEDSVQEAHRVFRKANAPYVLRQLVKWIGFPHLKILVED